MTSVRSPRQATQAVSSADFAAEIKQLQQRLRGVYRLHAHVLEKPKEPAANGKVYSKSDVRKIHVNLVRSMDRLPKVYTAALKYKGPKRAVNLNSGIRKPVQFDATMKQFIDNADFGNYRTYVETVDAKGRKAYVAQDSGQNLRANLPVISSQSIANPTALNALFNIYVAKNSLADPNNGLVFRADPLMQQVFGQTFARLAQQTRANLPAGVNDGDFKGGMTKAGKPRARYAKVDVTDAAGNKIKGADGKVLRQDDTTRKIYNNYWHVFNPQAIGRAYINSIIKEHKVATNDALFKLTDQEQDAYRAVITQSMATGAAPDFNNMAAQAIASLPGLDAQGQQRLQLRGRTDQEDLIARTTTKSYSLTKPRKD